MQTHFLLAVPDLMFDDELLHSTSTTIILLGRINCNLLVQDEEREEKEAALSAALEQETCGPAGREKDSSPDADASMECRYGKGLLNFRF